MITRRETPTDVRRGRAIPRLTSHVLRAGVTLIALAGCGDDDETTAYVGATVWDGTGGPLMRDAVILVRGDSIVDIGLPGRVTIPRGAVEHRLDGRFVIPGLIDLHTHAPRWSLTRYLAYGVTTIRHLGGNQDSVLALRDELTLGSPRGPRIFAAGPMIDGAPPLVPYAYVAVSATSARRAIDSLTLLDFRWAKAHAKITRGLLDPLMDEARTLRLPVAAHLGKVDALTAARLGVRTIEHLSGVVAAASAGPQAATVLAAYDSYAAGFRADALGWSDLDSASLDRVARALATAGVVMVPTLVTHELLSRLDTPAYLAAIDNSGVPAEIRRAYSPRNVMRQYGLSSLDLVLLRTSRDRQDVFVRRFASHGGIVGAGTDSPSGLVPPGASLHRELALLVQLGFSTERALLAATRDAAGVLDEASLGTLQAGHAADFVVLEANPLDGIDNLATIQAVVSRGTRYSPRRLRREWRP